MLPTLVLVQEYRCTKLTVKAVDANADHSVALGLGDIQPGGFGAPCCEHIVI
jgi:hypothetical protein